ncbi:MAG: aminotransferase class V-fold PLP-dependent enzyme [Oscillospiraceae bacterium]|nr:aminotransferase class V-fold PLP-dependent enzyme [Oscillospiraceae bacterium]
MNTSVYLDNAATTRISDTVLEGMSVYLKESYGNPSSLYALGRDAERAITKARERVAAALNCLPQEIYFTGSGSESNNWAIRQCTVDSGQGTVITSEFEHHAVLHVLGNNTILLPVYDNGLVSPEDLEKALSENPYVKLVTIMFANNEIGTVQPISEIGEICKKYNVLFHTDAVQAVGNIPIDVKSMNIDMLSLSGHKIHAMKGVGALYVNSRLRLPPLILGGAQENNRRAGTENVAGIVGLGIAIEEAVADMEQKNAELLKKRERIYNEVMKIERVRLNGELQRRLANNLNFSFEGIEGEALLLQLDLKGISASSGSACTSGSLDPSHVLLALGLPHEIAHGSLRITLSKYTTDNEIDYFLQQLPPIIEKLRALSPVWENIKREEAQ